MIESMTYIYIVIWQWSKCCLPKLGKLLKRGAVIYAFDQHPAGSDEGNEWVTLYNPSNESVNMDNWVLENVDGERETIAEGATLYPFAYYVYSPPYQWLDNSDEAITLRDTKGEERDKTIKQL